MKHQVKKIKFRGGKDANRMLMRKLCVNFFSSGVLTTTEAKAKAVKSVIDTVIARTAEETEANRRFVRQQVGRKNLIDALFSKVGPKVREIHGGYVSLKRAHVRINDGSQMVTVRWTHDIADLMREEPKTNDKKSSKNNTPAEKVSARKSAKVIKTEQKKTVKKTSEKAAKS